MADATADRIRPADLVAEGGVADSAEALIDAVYGARPGPLMKAVQMGHHSRLHQARLAENAQYAVPETPKLDFAEIERAAGITADDGVKIVAAAIHGADLEDAWVVYVAEDAVGSHFKGAVPYADLGSRGKSKQHVSEAEAFAETQAGRTLAKRRELQAQEGVKTTRRTRRTPTPDQPDGTENADGSDGAPDSEHPDTAK